MGREHTLSYASSPLIRPIIRDAVLPLSDVPSEDELRQHIWPLFSRVLNRPDHPKLGRPEIYLANHSLGRPLDCTADDVMGALDLWYCDMDGAWGPWIEARDKFRALVAPLIGAWRPDCIVPKTSAGQGLRAVLNAMLKPDRPLSIVATRGEFDSIDFILKMYADKGWAKVHWVEPARTSSDSVYTFPLDDLVPMAYEIKPDLLVTSATYFATGQQIDVETLVASVHQVGTKVLIDRYHQAGVSSVFWDTDADAPDFAIGGSYKYTRGGPGACWLYINPRHLDRENEPGALRTLDTGWFAKKDTFAYERTEKPLLAPGGDAWLESTPPILPIYQALAGLEFTLAMGVGRLCEYSLKQQALMRKLMLDAGVPMYDHDGVGFGAFSLLPHDNAPALSDALREEGVNTDARGKFVRFGPDLLNSREELELAAQITARVIKSL
jgi:kynureninase